MATFSIDPKILAGAFPVASLELSELLLSNDSRFTWLMLVPRRVDSGEIIDLSPEDQAALFREILTVSEVVRRLTGCDKLNLGALGNSVRQLHFHVIARFFTDALWPKAVWGNGPAVPYEAAARDKLIADIRAALPA